jgi:transcriptional regulator with XRE-family HTH domain
LEINLKKDKKITSKKIAEALGVTYRTIWTWESGINIPKTRDVLLMAQILDIDTSLISDYSISESSSLSFEYNYKEFIYNKQLNDLKDAINELQQLPNAKVETLINLYKTIKKDKNEIVRLKNRLTRAENLLNTLEPIIYVKDSKLKYKFINNSFIHLANSAYTKEDIVGISAENLFSHKEMEKMLAFEKRVISSGHRLLNKKTIIPNTNSMQIGILNILPHFNEKNELIEIVCTINDITEIIRVMERQEQLKEAINSLDEIVYIKPYGKNTKYIHISESTEKIYGRSANEFYNNPNLWSELIYPKDKDFINFDQKTNNIAKGYAKYRIIHKNGSIRYVHDKMFQMTDKFGNKILFGTISTTPHKTQ